ncbi:TPA: DUF551 domain-containing protein [Cronobacter sakazakii]|nr:DUF551 domain-containing protein [Cronobacter sakazakii]
MARELLAYRKERERAEPVAYYYPGDKTEPPSVALADEIDERQKANCVPLCAAPPAPVVADDELMAGNHIAWMNKNFPRKTFSDEEWEELSLYTWLAWRDSCRAAMLAAAPDFRENVNSSTNNFRENAESSTNNFRENAESSTSGWIKCSERMPETDDFVYIWPRPDFGVELHVGQYGKFDKRDAGWYAQLNEQNYGIAYHPITVTHWQPLPAAPGKEG